MNTAIFSLSLNKQLLTSCIVGLTLAIMPVAQAGYNPPATQKPPDSKQSSGSGTTRSGFCGDAENAALTLLAPQTHIGQTTSTHPTFAWFQNLEPFQMELKIFEVSSEGLKDWSETINLATTSGIRTYSLPANQPGLVIGKTYVWQVTIFCDQYLDKQITRSSTIKVLPQPPSLAKEEVTALEYARNSFWYDALEKSLNSGENSGLGRVGSSLIQDLIGVEEQRICSGLPQDVANCADFLEEMTRLQEEKLCFNSPKQSWQLDMDSKQKQCELIRDKNWHWSETLKWLQELRQLIS